MLSAKNVVLYLLMPVLNVLFWYYRALESEVVVRCSRTSAPKLIVSPVAIDVDCAEEASGMEAAARQTSLGGVQRGADERWYQPRRDLPRSCGDTQLDLDIYFADHNRRVIQQEKVQHPPETEGGEPHTSSAFLSSFLSTVSTAQMDSWRAERMASMTYAAVETLLLHSSSGGGEGHLEGNGHSEKEEGEEGGTGDKDELGREIKRKDEMGHLSGAAAECSSIDMHWVSVTDNRCLAVVKIQGIAAQRAYAIQRFDKSVDENNRGEKDRPEPHHPIHAPFKGRNDDKCKRLCAAGIVLCPCAAPALTLSQTHYLLPQVTSTTSARCALWVFFAKYQQNEASSAHGTSWEPL